MKIVVHVTHGKSFVFEQPDPVEAGGILGGVHPNRLFAQPQIIIQGTTSTSGFATPAVEAVEFHTEVEIEWLKHGGPGLLTSVDRETFAAALAERKGQLAALRNKLAPGDRIFGQGEMVMRSDRRFYLHFESVVGGQLDMRHNLSAFLEARSMAAMLPEGGALLINPANIVRWTLYPGPPDVPRNAWPASRIA